MRWKLGGQNECSRSVYVWTHKQSRWCWEQFLSLFYTIIFLLDKITSQSQICLTFIISALQHAGSSISSFTRNTASSCHLRHLNPPYSPMLKKPVENRMGRVNFFMTLSWSRLTVSDRYADQGTADRSSLIWSDPHLCLCFWSAVRYGPSKKSRSNILLACCNLEIQVCVMHSYSAQMLPAKQAC